MKRRDEMLCENAESERKRECCEGGFVEVTLERCANTGFIVVSACAHGALVCRIKWHVTKIQR